MGEELYIEGEWGYGVWGGGGEINLKLSEYNLWLWFRQTRKRSEERRLDIPVSNLVGVHLRKSCNLEGGEERIS